MDINYFWTPLIGQCQDRIALCAIGIVMDLDWLKDFLALAEQKNFSRAADARNVSQPAFSRRIRALEHREPLSRRLAAISCRWPMT